MRDNLSLFLVKGIVITFVLCYLLLTIVAIGFVHIKQQIGNNMADNMSVEMQEQKSNIDADIDNATSPTFVLATSVFMSFFSALVIGIPLYNMRCKKEVQP